MDTPTIPPISTILIYGKQKAGKTLAALNSPWEPVHIIDTERSSADYKKHEEVLIQKGILAHSFTRADTPEYPSFMKEVARIKESNIVYGTLILDTMGQISNWIGAETFAKFESMAEKQSQIVWGKVRDRHRSLLLTLAVHCKLLVFTAHEREYKKEKSARVNPALQELISVGVHITREPNASIPAGVIEVSRLPFFPPRIPQFTIAGLMQYIEKPADWDNLKEEEKVVEMPESEVGGYSEEGSYDQ